MSKKILAGVLAAVTFATAAPAFADDDDARHYQQNRAQYISYDKAAHAAVAHVGGGVAEDVDFEYSTRKGAYFDVDVRRNNGQEYKVKVNAKNGKIISSRLDD